MFCRYCGAELPNESSFCPKCGKETSLAPTAAVAPTSTVATSGPMDSGAYFSPGTATASPKSKKALFISKKALLILTAVVGMVIIGVVAFFIWRNTTVNQFNIPLGAMYNSKLNIGIRLGDSQEDIEKKLGVPAKIDGKNHIYEDGILIGYHEGIAISISAHVLLDSSDWRVSKNISISSSVSELVALWGAPSELTEENMIYNYGIYGNQMESSWGGNTSIYFGYQDDKVTSFIYLTPPSARYSR